MLYQKLLHFLRFFNVLYFKRNLMQHLKHPHHDPKLLMTLYELNPYLEFSHNFNIN